MGNARWTGVRLKDVLDRADVKAGAVQVRFNGLDEPVVADEIDAGLARPDARMRRVRDRVGRLHPVVRIGLVEHFITNIKPGDTLGAGTSTLARGIAFGGDGGVSRVDFSSDGGKSWQETQLGTDEGKYSFRQWQIRFSLPATGEHALMVRCTSSSGEMQPDAPNWNPAGFMRNVIEQTTVVAA
jgi:hypothetical protein